MKKLAYLLVLLPFLALGCASTMKDHCSRHAHDGTCATCCKGDCAKCCGSENCSTCEKCGGCCAKKA